MRHIRAEELDTAHTSPAGTIQRRRFPRKTVRRTHEYIRKTITPWYGSGVRCMKLRYADNVSSGKAIDNQRVVQETETKLHE